MNQAADNASPPSTLQRIRSWWQRLSGTMRRDRGGGEGDRETEKLLEQFGALIEESRLERGGEHSARMRAQQMAAHYRGATLEQRSALLQFLSREFAPDRESLQSAVAMMQAAADDAEASRAEAQLRVALGHPRAQFFTQFNLLPDGVKFLVDLRADVLKLLPETPALEVLKVELDALMTSWFDPGFLELRRITWEAPAAILEKLIDYEAVHAIESWRDLRNRLDADRRCYGFFHPRMPGEPLIFVEIALVKGFPESIQALLDLGAPVQDAAKADTAVFYSISNTQRGLHGISFGNLLLKRVIEDLRRGLPGLKVYATLSPIPGFRRWLDKALAADPGLVPAAELQKIADALGEGSAQGALVRALSRPDWSATPAIASALCVPLERLCARYLVQEKSGNRPRDPVAAFHLNNGARVNRILWLANTSERGMKESHGLMVSYRYDLSEVDDNHERFARSGEIAAARRVKRLVA